MTGQPENSEAAALASLVKWSADCPLWQRDALKRLSANGALTSADIDALLAIAKGEQVPEFFGADDVRDPAAGRSLVTLRQLKDVEHVNALAANERLTFGRSGLTIIYGDNGSGKSGYARILKKMCRARVAARGERILPNIYTQNPGPPQATIDFTVNDQNRSTTWIDGQATDPLLSAVSVFDARTANIHVDQTNDVAYTPLPLKILATLAQTCQTLKDRLGAEITAIQRQTPGTITNSPVHAETAVGKLIGRLGPATNPQEVTTLATLNPAELDRLNQLNADLGSDPARAARQVLALKTKVEGYLARLEGLASAISDERRQALHAAATAYQIARQAAEAASAALFSDEPLTHIGSEIWRSLWESARSYSDQEAYPDHSFPVVEPAAVCVLCQQDLSPDAAARLSRFEAFIKDDSQLKETNAKSAYDAALTAFRGARIGETDLASIVTCVTDELLDPPLAQMLREASQGCLVRHQDIEIRHASPEVSTYAESPQLPFDQLRVHIDNLTNRASGLTAEADSEPRKALLAEQQELADRQWLGTVLGDVLAHIERLKQVVRLEEIKRDSATNRITSKSTEIARTLVTDALRAQFAIEADRLGVASLAIELRQDQSSQGIPRFKVALTRKPTASVGDVLSEGEHRCVALAAFLAELATTDSKSAIVFDDPISSLDHMHREKVAERLIAESRERQVIVFTHDIAFLFLLDQACQECEPRPHCTFRSISRGQDHSGFCNTDPPFKARPLNDVVTSMENRLNSEKIHHERGNQAQWEQTVRSLQEQLRTAWERAVEEAVSPVLKRLSNKVDTTGLARVTALTIEDCEVMRAAFGRCSALLHSQAAGLNTPLPQPATIQAEITALRDWISSVKQRQDAIRPV